MADNKPYRKRCPSCHKVVEMRLHQRYCSHSCAQVGIWRGRTMAQRRLQGMRAGRASGRRRSVKREAAVLALVGTLDIVGAYRKGYAQGYSAGWYRGARDIPGQMGYPRGLPPVPTRRQSA